MEVVSQISGNANGVNPPNPNHQSIGRNGSFWLPPSTSDSFDSNLRNNIGKDLKSQDPKTQKQPTKNLSQQVSANSIKALSTDKKTASTTLPGKNPAKTEETKQLPREPVIGSRSRQANPKASVPISKRTTFDNKPDSLIINREAKVNKHSSLNKTDCSLIQTNPDSNKKEGRSKNHSTGTRNAQLSESMFNSNQSTDFGHHLLRSATPDFHKKSQVLKSVVSKAVPPRISYITKFEKKIVRFALDLPDGAKLGVRLEKNNEDFSLSFISQDKNIQDMIAYLGSEIFKNTQDIKIKIFGSYQDMDQYNSLAA
ncbi:MAG: hypothetical protein VX153_02690 [Verrucomicrobiota bacterium]|nr:hypothetical protein [Verrucomicrobiota bacterium]